MKTFKLESDQKLKTGFRTPDGYFEDFSGKILLQLPEEKHKIIPLFQRKKQLFFVAAAILIIGLIVPIYLQFSAKSDELDSATLENHLTYQTELNSYELITEIEEKNINNILINTPVKNETIEDFLTANPNLEQLITE
jgi:hypothetical protein